MLYRKFNENSRQAGIRIETIFEAMQKIDGVTIIAGGDTIDAAGKCGTLESYSHTSLAGGATLEFLAGKELPALKAMVEL